MQRSVVVGVVGSQWLKAATAAFQGGGPETGIVIDAGQAGRDLHNHVWPALNWCLWKREHSGKL